jgi:hypothetical protein
MSSPFLCTLALEAVPSKTQPIAGAGKSADEKALELHYNAMEDIKGVRKTGFNQTAHLNAVHRRPPLLHTGSQRRSILAPFLAFTGLLLPSILSSQLFMNSQF